MRNYLLVITNVMQVFEMERADNTQKQIIVSKGKSLRLDNVLIKSIFEFSALKDDGSIRDEFSLDLEVEKMVNEIKVKGANPVGPLIQFSGASGKEDDVEIKIVLMMQADRFINNIQTPYRMEPVINIKNCLYTRFKGMEEDIQYAYQKIQVTAYEEDIKLKGSSYTIFLDSEDNGTITADIFMARADA